MAIAKYSTNRGNPMCQTNRENEHSGQKMKLYYLLPANDIK